MTIRRRSRMRRTRAGKPILITPRDIAIFCALADYRYLRSTYLHAFAGGASVTRFKERLGDLFHEGYLDRPEAQWQLPNCRHAPAVYELGRGGERALAELGIVDDEQRVCLGPSAHRQFSHSLMICEILASIELATRAAPDLRFISWPEILAKAPESTRIVAFPLKMPVGSDGLRNIVPDAIFGLEYRQGERKTYRFFVLEADRNTMPVRRMREGQTFYLGKLAAYREIIRRKLHASHWGLPNLFVLTVTLGSQRLADMLRKSAGPPDDPCFLFKAVESDALTRPIPDLLQTPWERAGLPPLHIGESH